MSLSWTASLIDAQARAALDAPETPAYVYSEAVLRASAADALAVASRAGCGLLYTLKACGLAGVMQTLAPSVDGFAASSAFEARAAESVRLPGQTLHCYSPAFRADEMGEVAAMADYLSVNSMAQLAMARRANSARASVGLRVNPQISLVAERRYDPCRPYSKLGVPLREFDRLVNAPDAGVFVDGVHIHNNCESDDLSELSNTVEAMASTLRRLDGLRWVNLGGGYYFGPDTDAEPLAQVARWLKSELGAAVFVEPGTSLVQQAGMLVSEALDVFENGGKDVAVLDASTSHMPEVFEYGFAPDVRGPICGGDQATILAGRSCLAGDVFGEYRLRESLRTGDRVALMDAGAYSHARAAPFNGIPIPSAYLLREDGEFERMSAYGYKEFASRNGVGAVATA